LGSSGGSGSSESGRTFSSNFLGEDSASEGKTTTKMNESQPEQPEQFGGGEHQIKRNERVNVRHRIVNNK
jgi:hypothetical protein